MPAAFPGFSPKAITFLRQLKKNNSRDWFQPRKEQFELLLRQPMLELSAIVLHHLRTFAVEHVVEPRKAVHRIYRDVRFSKDKSPYKTNISAMFDRKGLSHAGAGYYFSLASDEFSIAGGIYMPGPIELAAVRAEIAAHPALFRKSVDDKKMTQLVGPLLGEQLTRVPKAFSSEDPAADLLRRKQFYYRTSLPVTAATSPGLDKILIKHFKAMSSTMDYLNGVMLKARNGDADEQRPVRPKPMF